MSVWRKSSISIKILRAVADDLATPRRRLGLRVHPLELFEIDARQIRIVHNHQVLAVSFSALLVKLYEPVSTERSSITITLWCKM